MSTRLIDIPSVSDWLARAWRLDLEDHAKPGPACCDVHGCSKIRSLPMQFPRLLVQGLEKLPLYANARSRDNCLSGPLKH